ncbi:MAG TPA: SCO family protein [Anaerolineales bacterium]|nr:SCO family protein [Anaerolineales bacterium]
MKLRHYLLLGLAILIGLAAAYGGLAFTRPHVFQGSVIDPPVQAIDFTLTDQSGKDFRLNDQKGKVVLLFFGYTNCPDECPVTLADFVKIKARLGERADQVKFVLVTTDPERDTPARMQEYLANFDPAFVGLVGDSEGLETVWDAYGVYRAEVEAGSADESMVEHSTRIYLIDANGNLRVTYLFGTESDLMAEDVAYLIREGLSTGLTGVSRSAASLSPNPDHHAQP